MNGNGEDARANIKIPPTWTVRVTVTAPPHIAAPREIAWRFLHQPSTSEVETMLLHAVRSVTRELEVAAVTLP